MGRIRTWYYDIRNGLQAYRAWYQVIWKWRCWDHQYAEDVFRHALYLLQRQIKTANRHTTAEDDVAAIQAVLEALDRLGEDDYFDVEIKKLPIADEYYEDCEKRWDEWMATGGALSQASETICATAKRCYAIGNFKRKKDRALVAKAFVNKMERWWE